MFDGCRIKADIGFPGFIPGKFPEYLYNFFSTYLTHSELSSQINSARLSFADPEDMLKYLDIEPGAVSIMGLMNDKENAVRLLIDEDVLKEEYLGCHPCVCTSSLKMKVKDVIEKFLPSTGHDYITVHLVGE